LTIALPDVSLWGNATLDRREKAKTVVVQSFNGKPMATAFPDLHQLDDADAFGGCLRNRA